MMLLWVPVLYSIMSVMCGKRGSGCPRNGLVSGFAAAHIGDVEMKYPYEMEAVLRIDYQKGRPIRLDKVDREAEREALLVKKMEQFRSAFNPTCKNSN